MRNPRLKAAHMRQRSGSAVIPPSQRFFALVLPRDKTKFGAVIRAEPFSRYWSIWFSTSFPLRAQQAAGCILKFLDRLAVRALSGAAHAARASAAPIRPRDGASRSESMCGSVTTLTV
jgi:hypothetical protein